ncbi:DUF3822 family protein [Mucilaginibacter paludis]|nr:DUF3822 family protein [Mucilaginibacter paludis]
MSNGLYNYYDPEFNPQITKGNQLLIDINDNYFSFVILQTESKRVLVWGENYAQSELDNPDTLKQILTVKYEDVKVVVPSDSFTIIPKALYNEHDVDAYRKLLTLGPTDTVLVNGLDASNYVIFKVTEALMKSVGNHVNLNSIFFAGKVLIAALNYLKPDAFNLYAHIQGNKLQLVYLKDDLLRFYNSYAFSNPDELMYYIVLVANELDLNLDETSLILSGEVSISDKKIQRLSDLLPKVYLNQTQIVALPLGFLPHQVLLLSGLTLCESLVEN